MNVAPSRMAKKRKKKRRSGRAAEAGEAAEAEATPDTQAPASASATDASSTAPTTAERAPVPDATTAGRRRARQNLFIGLFLLYSLAMPAHYYATDGGLDERFAWRMFSTVRQHRCRADVNELRRDGASGPLHLQGALHVAWIKLLNRGRPAVEEKFLRARCAQEDIRAVRLRRVCNAPDGSQVPEVRVELDCDSGKLERTTGDAS